MSTKKESELSINYNETEDIFIVFFNGTLDIFNLQKIKESVENHISGKKKVIFDMSKLEYIDSAGIGFIVGTLKRLKTENSDYSLAICGLNEYLEGIFKLISFSRLIPILENLEDAKKILNE